MLGTLLGRPVASPSCLWCARHPGALDGISDRVSLGRRNDPRIPLGSGGERIIDVDERARRSLDEISRLHRRQVVAVVTHLDVLRSIVALEIEEEYGIFPDWSVARGSYLRLVRGRTNWRRVQ